MKATDTQLLKFLKEAEQFSVPIFQRMYSWTETECRRLWDDILRAGSSDKIESHFLGSIVYIEEKQFQIAGHNPMLVIDGQQRLTTLALLIEALARSLGSNEQISGFTAKELREDYLLNTTKTGDRRYKLLLTQTDKQTMIELVEQRNLPEEYSLRLESNFSYFMKQLSKLNGDFSSVFHGLSKLVIVNVSLKRGDDNPQLIFECMNSTGLDLSQADLIRNYILMGLEASEQNFMYNSYWRPMEEAFGQEAFAKEFDGFMRYYLAVKNRHLPNIRDVYREFKIFAQNQMAEYGVEELLKDIHTYAQYYCAIALGNESEAKLLSTFVDLHDLKANVSYPLLMEIYSDYSKGLIDIEEFIQLVRLIECYVFRRAVCDIPTNSMNKTFASFAKNIDKENYVESVEANFMLLKSYRKLPNDEEFYTGLITRNIYNFQRCLYLLRKLENNERKEPVPVNEYTIEHIMPQNENLSLEWRNSLGDDWLRIHSEYLHKLGNLTLTGYNSEYSDKPFIAKRDMENGFSNSPLKLNNDLRNLDDWNKASIVNRADRLANIALNVWSYPSLSVATVNTHQPNMEIAIAEYTISDHPTIDKGGVLHEIYTEIRQEIMNLDPCVSEEFRKNYAVYIAEEIFVSVGAVSNGLSISLYMPYSELQDTRSMARRVPRSYNWGRAEADLLLQEPDEVPYVMSLVRQAFRHQMENED